MQEFGGKKVEAKQSNLWSGWPSESWLKEKDKGESEEAAVGIESDGRRKEIADNLSLDWKVGTFLFIRNILLIYKKSTRLCA